jgi:hypothetical protein
MENNPWFMIFYNSAPAILGGLIALFWGKIQKVLKALKELGDVIDTIVKSLEDKQITPEEVESIKKEIKEALAAFKAIIK